jgi:hypothetical protein
MACAVLLATVASASEEDASAKAEARRMFVGLVPIPLSQGLIALDGERAVGSKLSVRMGVRLGARFTKDEGVFGRGSQADFRVGMEPGLRYYLTGTALDGLWIGPHLELARVWFTSEVIISTLDGTRAVSAKSHGQSWSAGAGALIGYSMVLPQGLTVQAGVGFSAYYSSSRSAAPRLSPVLSPEVESHSRWWGLSERATLAVGWAF